MTAKAIFANDANLIELIDKAREAQSTFRAELHKLRAHLNPEVQVEALRSAMECASTPEELETLGAELARVEGDSARIAYRRAVALAHVALDAFREAVAPVIERGQTLVESAITKAVAEETAFFARFGLPREATQVSGRYNELKRDVAHYLTVTGDTLPDNQRHLQRSRAPHRNHFDDVLAFFDASGNA